MGVALGQSVPRNGSQTQTATVFPGRGESQERQRCEIGTRDYEYSRSPRTTPTLSYFKSAGRAACCATIGVSVVNW
jgi:hypothetical protein